MYRIIVLISLLTVSVAVYANHSQEPKWIYQLEHPKNKQYELKDSNFLSKYVHYNFSSIFKPRTNFIGYIGNNYQRLTIVFTSVTKSTVNNKEYLVKGYSKVKSNKCDFSGVIQIKQIREYKKLHFGAEDMYDTGMIKSEGLVLANYKLDEYANQKYSGVFKGVMTLYWFVDVDGRLNYDNTEINLNRYANNQYIGTWTEYGKKAGKVANWGEYRVPFSGDLDIGVNEFNPKSKFESRGWRDYHASPESKACQFSSYTPNRKEYTLCIRRIKRMEKNTSPPSWIMSPKDFSIVLDNTKKGNDGAQNLSFTIFDITRKSHSIDVEYAEDTAIALSYSIEKNPLSFLKEIPEDLLPQRDVLASLCCNVDDKYSEDYKYMRKHLEQRLIMIRKVKRHDLSSRKKIVENVIRENIKTVNEAIEYLKNSGQQ